ncbi:MAG: TetR/AcrR family transcriptional regulator [Desulfobacterium sp.]|nr:TetR/AcrR family transcriptional regulator [Desulfobacterium sp.]
MREELRIERKNRLLKAAAEVFCEKGYAGTTIADVATHAGIGKGTIYGYFSSKEDLFFDLFCWYAQGIMADTSFETSGDAGSIKDRFLAYTHDIIQEMLASVHMYPLTLEFWSAAASGNMRNRLKDAMEKMYDEYRQLIGGILQQGIAQEEFHPDTDTAAIASGIIATLDAMGLQYWINPDFDIQTAAMQTVSAILTGISVPPEQKWSSRIKAKTLTQRMIG